jgi:hypothetical protein
LDKTVTGASDKAEELFKAGYPAVYAHLERYKEQLWARNKAETGIRYEWYALQRWGSEFWEEFERPKIVVPAISDQPNAAFDSQGHYPNNKATFFVTNEPWLPLAVLNCPVSLWFAKQNFSSKQGGFWDFEPRYSSTFPIPRAADAEKRAVKALAQAVELSVDNRLEQLLNGFVYELFFKDELHARGLTLFDEAERAGLSQLAGLEGAALVKAAESFAAIHLVPGATLRTMLSDLATLDAVRIIEGRE